jgi:hypothetical protein
MKLPQKIKDDLWWLIISVDYDLSRIVIADHETTDALLTLWLEDKYDFKGSLNECLQLDIPLKEFAKAIVNDNLNSYEGAKLNVRGNFVKKTRIEINKPIKWYREDASITEQQWARESILKTILQSLTDTEIVTK